MRMNRSTWIAKFNIHGEKNCVCLTKLSGIVLLTPTSKCKRGIKREWFKRCKPFILLPMPNNYCNPIPQESINALLNRNCRLLTDREFIFHPSSFPVKYEPE